MKTIAFRMDDVGSSSKLYEQHGRVRWPVLGISLPLAPFANWLFLKRTSPFQGWAPYRELDRADWENLFSLLRKYDARLTVAVTACWVEPDGSLTPFPSKFPGAASALRDGEAQGLVEIACHGLTHCVLEDGCFRPKRWASNRVYHREFYQWLPREHHKRHIFQAVEVLSSYFKNSILTMVPPGNVWCDTAEEYARQAGLRYLSCSVPAPDTGNGYLLRINHMDVLVFHDRDIVLRGPDYLENRLTVARQRGLSPSFIKDLGVSPVNHQAGAVRESQAGTRRLFEEQIDRHLHNYYWEQLGLKDWRERIAARTDEVPHQEIILRAIERFTGGIAGKKVLVVGSGWGGACVAARRLGAAEVVGIDVDAPVNEIASLRMDLEGLDRCCLTGVAERLPFRDGEFDYVHCFAVLEHVNNVRASLEEMVRVTRKGGHIFIFTINSLRPFERHYRVIYPPVLPRKIGRLYLKLLGRPPDFINTVNYLWPARIVKLLDGARDIEVENVAREYRDILFFARSYPDDDAPLPAASGKQGKRVPMRRLIASTLQNAFTGLWDRVFRTGDSTFLIRKR